MFTIGVGFLKRVIYVETNPAPTKANQANLAILNNASSKPVLIIPADEEAEIARLAENLYAEVIHVSTSVQSR